MYRWVENAGRFVDSRGRFVSETQVRRVIDAIADAASERMAQASARLLAGDMSLAAWQLEMQQVVKLAHVAAATIAHGGGEQMTFSRWGSAGNEIKAQYSWLRDFAAQVRSGEQKLNGSLTARARQYGQAARATLSKIVGEGQQRRGFRFEKNVLRSGESCSGCRAESARGQVPIGTLVPVGSRHPCLRNCHCEIRYARTAEEEQAA